MSLYDDRRWEAELPDGAAGVCECCGEPAFTFVDGLGECCRCAGCDDPRAPIERRGLVWCQPCALEDGWYPRLERESETAE